MKPPTPTTATRPVRREAMGFTLIELLAVMAIIVMIMLVSIVGFTNIGRGSAAQKSADYLETTIALARQHAITRNVPVIILFLDRDFDNRNTGCSGIGPPRARSYAVFDTVHRVYLTGWTELPLGVVFDSDYSPSSPDTNGRNLLTTGNDLVWNRNTGNATIPFPSTDSTNRLVRLPGLAFKTDGSVYNRPNSQAHPRRICIAEGVVDTTGNVTRRPNGARYGVKVSLQGATTREDNT